MKEKPSDKNNKKPDERNLLKPGETKPPKPKGKSASQAGTVAGTDSRSEIHIVSRPGQRSSHSSQHVSASQSPPIQRASVPKVTDRSGQNVAREAARGKLAAAGALNTTWKAPPGTVLPTDDELIELGTLPPGSPSVEDLVNESRGKR